MDNKQAVRILEREIYLCNEKGILEDSEYVQALIQASKALSQEPCIDCISREIVRRIIDSGRTKEQMLDMLANTPSVQPKVLEDIKVEIQNIGLTEHHIVSSQPIPKSIWVLRSEIIDIIDKHISREE